MVPKSIFSGEERTPTWEYERKTTPSKHDVIPNRSRRNHVKRWRRAIWESFMMNSCLCSRCRVLIRQDPESKPCSLQTRKIQILFPLFSKSNDRTFVHCGT